VATSRLQINLESGPILAILPQAIQKAINLDGFPHQHPLTISSLLLSQMRFCASVSALVYEAYSLRQVCPHQSNEYLKTRSNEHPQGDLPDIL